jgi:hypothetical protein
MFHVEQIKQVNHASISAVQFLRVANWSTPQAKANACRYYSRLARAHRRSSPSIALHVVAFGRSVIRHIQRKGI